VQLQGQARVTLMSVIGWADLENKEIENQRDHDHVNNQAHEYETVEQLFLRGLHEEKAISVD
jgi:hypothetical protein